MLKRVALIPVIAALIAFLTPTPACAQILWPQNKRENPQPEANITYVVPQDLDPPGVLTFRQDGAIYTTDDQGVPLTGQTLLQTGLELHGQIPGLNNGTFRDVVEVHMSFSPFDGKVDIQPEAKFGFETWRIVHESKGPQKMFRLLKQPDSAPINDDFDPNPKGSPDQSFALLFASVQNDPKGTFANASFAFQPFTTYQPLSVPEPGALALFSSLLIAAGIPLYRRARRRSIRQKRGPSAA